MKKPYKMSRRALRKFALFPTKIEGSWVWLRFYLQDQWYFCGRESAELDWRDTEKFIPDFWRK